MSEDIDIFKKEILGSFDQLVRELNADLEDCFKYPARFALDGLLPYQDLQKMSKVEIEKFLLDSMIKYGKKVTRWGKVYKNEVISKNMVLILTHVTREVKELRSCVLLKFDFNSTKKVEEYLRNKLEYYHSLVSSHDGLLYVDAEYRESENRLLKTRFDVIWNINEQYTLFPNEQRPDSHLVSKDVDYPFVDFNMDEWIRFETSFRIVPLIRTFLTRAKTSFVADTIPEKETSIDFDPIFYDAEAQAVFLEFLVKLNAINQNGITKSSRFRGVCDALYLELKKKKYKIIKSFTGLTEFIAFLNKEFNSNIPEKGGRIINRNGSSIYEEDVKFELEKYLKEKGN